MSGILLSMINLYCRPGEPSFNLERHRRWISESAEGGMIVFPELSISGYINDRDRLLELKSDIDGCVQELLKISAGDPSKLVLAGAPVFSDDGIFIAHHCITGGRIVFSHRKVLTGPSERSVFSSGENPQVFFTQIGSDSGLQRFGIGIQLCYESHFPEISIMQQAAGAQLIIMPFASPREKAEEKLLRLKKYLPARAYDNSLYVACCNQVRETENTGRAPGAAMIIDPRGDILAESASSEESSCSAVIDPLKIDRIKNSGMGYFRGESVW